MTRQTDIFAASIVLWEALTTRRLFAAEREADVIEMILAREIIPPSVVLLEAGFTFEQRALVVLQKLDRVVLRGLARDVRERFPTARDMAAALEACIEPAAPSVIGEWVEAIARDVLMERATRIANLERDQLATPERELNDALQGISPETAPQPLFPEHADPSVKHVAFTPPPAPSPARSRRMRKPKNEIPTYAMALVAVALAALVALMVVVAWYLLQRR